jgi:hypothetical protein
MHDLDTLPPRDPETLAACRRAGAALRARRVRLTTGNGRDARRASASAHPHGKLFGIC